MGRVARPSVGRHGGSCERSKLVGPGLSRGARQACRRQRPRGMEPGHLLCRRRARSRPQGARTRRRKQTGNQRWPRRSRSQHSTQNTRRGNWKHRATEGPRPPQRPSTSRKRRTSRPALTEHVGDERNLIRTVSVRRTGQGRANRYAVYLDRQCTADIVGSECTAYRQRDGLHGQRGRRSPHRRTHTETAGRARGGLRPGRGADRLARGGGLDWVGCEGASAAQGHCCEKQKAPPAPRSAERSHHVGKSTQEQWRVLVSRIRDPVSRAAD